MRNPNNNRSDNSDTRDNDQALGHTIPNVVQVDESLPSEPQFEDPIASPSVTGEESPSGDAPDGEPVDIDDQLKSIGYDNKDTE